MRRLTRLTAPNRSLTPTASPPGSALGSQTLSPASVSPIVLGTTVCVYMHQGHSVIETGYHLMREGFQGMTFTGPQAGDVAVEAHLHYCPDQPLTGG